MFKSKQARGGEPASHPRHIHVALVRAGLDPERLVRFELGWPHELRFKWLPRFALMMVLFGVLELQHRYPLVVMDQWLLSGLYLLLGLVIIQASCHALLQATIAIASRLRVSHYLTATLGEIVATLPEIVVVAYLVVESPLAAFVMVMMTLYNNTLVFSFYSFFLPKDKRGRFLMPKPITDAGNQILIAGGALGIICGLWMIVAKVGNHGMNYVGPFDLLGLAIAMLVIFVVYLIKLVREYAEEEEQVVAALQCSEQEQASRQQDAYEYAGIDNGKLIVLVAACGLVGAFVGGHSVATFAGIALHDLGLSDIVTAFLLAACGGMSEYMLLWSSHRKGEYGIALANAFGGITQVVFLLLPFTLLGIFFCQVYLAPQHLDFPLSFSVPIILLLSFMFPTFYTLSSLLTEDHTFGMLDTAIMTVIVLLLIVLLLTNA
ncbi:hypothetical protein [Ketobacter sp.]|uniref:hypothetical protein n=1 Tax=Ketobacter sp. TaxID=2083498 RepID=UPI000F204512|nr:hypothetical protein [Ketobacter sp.]RLT92195.1 MAG: hypothetical protein D9N14_22025 [Ketobacter sp.]